MNITKGKGMYSPLNTSTPRTATTAPATAPELGVFSSVDCTAARVTPNTAAIEKYQILFRTQISTFNEI